MLILIGIILILIFIIAEVAAWTFLGWFLWVLLAAGVILIVTRMLRPKRKR